MDGLQLFRKLGVGAKFDFKRFSKDAEKLKIISKTLSTETKPGDVITEINRIQKRKHNEDDKKQPLKIQRVEVENENLSSDSDQEPEEELQILGNITSKEKTKKKRTKIKTKQKLAALHQEEVNRLRNQHRINVIGTDLPEPVRSFENLSTVYKLSDVVMKNINDLGYTEPTPIQRQAIPAMINQREIMACAPTGSGKTAAFVIPIIHSLKKHSKKGLRALVLAPTRELAKQINRDFQRLSERTGLKLHYIDKTQTGDQTSQFDILISTPNRLVYQLQQDPPQINLHTVQWLVVDESDKLFEEGKTGFRDQLAVIYKSCDAKNVRRAMFSATFTHDVEEWCKVNLDNVIQIYVGAKNSATQTIQQELQFVGTEYGKLYAIREIIRKGIDPPMLIFVQSKERAQELFSELIYDGMNVDVIHSDRPQNKRDEVVNNFRSGKVWILICTELMGRGIDFKGVNLVINYDFPNSAISYIHRIGRTGRAGRQGRAVTFFTEGDKVNLRSIANILVEAGCPVPEYMLQMKKPSKKRRKKLVKTAPKREHISTALKADIDKAKRKREIIKRLKLKKLEGQKATDTKKVQLKKSEGLKATDTKKVQNNKKFNDIQKLTNKKNIKQNKRIDKKRVKSVDVKTKVRKKEKIKVSK